MNKETLAPILMIYIEPTPYILGLIHEIEVQTDRPVKVYFVKENLSQPWGLSLEGKTASVLPTGLKGIWWAISAITKKPKILHLAGWGNPLMIISMLLGLVFRIPISIESDTQLPLALAAWKRLIKASVYPLLFKVPSVFFPGGSRQAEYLRHYGVSEEKIVPSQMTVDVCQIQTRCSELGIQGRNKIRQELKINQNDMVFIFVGRLVAHKGLNDLLAAFEQVSKHYTQAHLLVVGDGPEANRMLVASQANSAVHPLGRLDQDGVIGMLNASDVAVVPSHFEPWGLVVNEAMAAGLPVIASDRVGAVDDLVRHGQNGIVFPARDHHMLVSAMEYLYKNPDKRREFAEAGRALISRWTLADSAKIMVDSWLAIKSKT